MENLGIIYNTSGERDKALQLLQEALNLSIKLNSEKEGKNLELNESICNLYGNIGNIYFYMNNYQKAIASYLGSLEYNKLLPK